MVIASSFLLRDVEIMLLSLIHLAIWVCTCVRMDLGISMAAVELILMIALTSQALVFGGRKMKVSKSVPSTTN